MNSEQNLENQTQLEFLRRENLSLRNTVETLKRENHILERQNEEIVMDADNQNSRLVTALKKKINNLQHQNSERETEFEEQLNSWKRKFNEAHRENNLLHKKIRDLEMSKFEEEEVKQIRDSLAGKNDEIRRLNIENIQLEENGKKLDTKLRELVLTIKRGDRIDFNRLNRDLNQASRRSIDFEDSKAGAGRTGKPKNISILNSQEGGLERKKTIKEDQQSSNGRRGMIRKNSMRRSGNSFRLNRSGSSFNSRNSSNSRPSSQKSQDIGEEERTDRVRALQSKFRAVLREKKKLEKVQIDLSGQIMQMQKQAKQKREEMLNTQEMQLSNVISTLKNEKEFIESQYSNEKRILTDKIQQLEAKLSGSEDQVLKFGEAIEKLNDELKIREDPAKNALSIVDYLEKFSRHQTTFLREEVKKYESEFKTIKDEASIKEKQAFEYINSNKELSYKFEKQKNENKILSEILSFRNQQLETLEKEKKMLESSLNTSEKEKNRNEQMNRQIDRMVIFGIDLLEKLDELL